MSRILAICIVVLTVLNGWAQQSILTGAPRAGGVTEVIPNVSGATNTYTANWLFDAGTVNPNVFRYPVVITLRTNDNFVVQDQTGYNLLGVRADTYSTNSGSLAWEIGSSQHTATDVKFWLGSAAGNVLDFIQNSVLKDGYQLQTGGNGQGMRFQVVSPAMSAIDPSITGVGPGLGNGYVTIIDSKYGTFYPVSIVGNTLQAAQAVSIGAGAGTGGSVGVTVDAKASDVSVQVTLVTGHTGTASGALFTYTLEAYDAYLDATFPIKPVFSAANSGAAGVAAVVYISSATRATFVFSSTQALPIDTTLKWNFIIAR